MWPIYFLCAEYAVTYLLMAGAAYVCVSVLANRSALGKRLFMTILGFGAAALAGYMLTGIVMEFMHPGAQSFTQTSRILTAVAYLFSGAAGGWLVWRLYLPAD
jgi:hypothetical protein